MSRNSLMIVIGGIMLILMGLKLMGAF